MPKALFFNVPAHGHINPSLPLVTELVKRGHQIDYFGTDNYRAQIEAAGATFQRYTIIEGDYFERRGLSGAVPQKVAYHLLNTTEQLLPDLLERARALRPDYVIYDGMCPWGYFAAQILKLPSVASLSLLPITSPPLHALLKREMMRLIFEIVGRNVPMGLGAIRRSQALGKIYHVPPLKVSELFSAPADLALGYTSQEFLPYAETISKSVRLIGRTLNSEPVPQYVKLEAEQRLIYVSLGTLNNEDISFFRACIDAFAGMDEVVLISTGNRINPEVFGALPENIFIQTWVPQIDVLKQAALFITHGGVNSVHDGLYFGVPLLLVPQQAEQTITALRVVELGAGLILKKSAVSAESLRTHAARLLHEPHFKTQSQKLGDTLRNAGGVARGADEIEALIG